MNTAATYLSPLGLMDFRVVPEIVAIGTSTGGPEALRDLLPQLPADLPVGVIVVQHMPAGFTGPLAKRLNTISAIEVCEAEAGDMVEPGKVYIAPAGRHIAVVRHGSEGKLKTEICLSDYPLGTLHRPSADVMMASVAEAWAGTAAALSSPAWGRTGWKA